MQQRQWQSRQESLPHVTLLACSLMHLEVDGFQVSVRAAKPGVWDLELPASGCSSELRLGRLLLWDPDYFTVISLS